MQSFKCFFRYEFSYRDHHATLELRWSSIDSPWPAEVRTIIRGERYGYVSSAGLVPGLSLDEVVDQFEVRVADLIDQVLGVAEQGAALVSPVQNANPT